MNKNDPVKTIKCKLKTILCKNTDNSCLFDVIDRSNNIAFMGSYFIRSFVLHQYKNNKEIPNLNKNFIMSVFRTLSKKSCGPKTKNPIQLILEEFYRKHFAKLIFPGENVIDEIFSNNFKFDAKNLSYVLQQMADTMEVSYRNNIQMNFFKYMNQYINQNFPYDKTIYNNKKEWKGQLRELKNSIINNDKKCDERYHKWINKNINMILPSDYEKSYFYDIKKNPFKYFKYMIAMNHSLDNGGLKKFQPIPLRTDMKNKYITINTNALVDILPIKNKNELFLNIRKKQKDIWGTIFDMHKVKSFKNYSFNYQIQTDGFAVSINYIHNDAINDKNKKSDAKLIASQNKKKNIKNTNTIKNSNNIVDKKKKNSKEFEYIEDIIKIDENLTNMKKMRDMNKLVYIDPGKRSIGTFMDGNNNIYNYRTNRRIHETLRKKYNRQICNKTKSTVVDKFINTSIKYYNDTLTKYNKKTMNIDKFEEYTKKKIRLRKLIMDEKNYQTYLQKLSWFLYINKQKHESKIMNELKTKYGKDSIMIIGDWGDKNKIKYMSTPCMGFKRLLKNNFKTYLIDEYKTSKLHNETLEETNNLSLLKNKKEIRLHAVLTYTMSNGRIGCINRDINAVKNMKNIVSNLLETKRRPMAFTYVKPKSSQPNKIVKNNCVK